MPIIQESIYLSPHLKYDAPVNEKTQKVREMFDMDEETGYPRQYNWRSMSRLGQKYNYEDPFLKFDPHDPNSDLSMKVTLVGFSVFASSLFYYWFSSYYRRPIWCRLPAVTFFTATMSGFGFWSIEKTRERQGIKNAIAIDYVRKHPERFGPIERTKFREVLYKFVPAR